MKISKRINFLFQIETVAAGAALFIYSLIFFYIKRGVSCDEGFYLMGYLKNQELAPMINDFHHIVRFITPSAMHDNLMYFRYLRFGLDFISVFLFGLMSFYWLKNKIKTFNISGLLYVSLILLSGAMSYTYTTPTISFDHLQHILYFFAFAVFIAADLTKNNIVRIICLLATGVFIVLAIANYLPSGLLLFAVFVVLIMILHFDKSAIYRTLYLCGGILTGILFYHIFINPVDVFVENAAAILNENIDNDKLDIISLIAANMKLTTGNVIGGYDGLSLAVVMCCSAVMFLLVQIPSFAIGFFSRKANIHSFIVAIAIILLICSFFFIREIYLLRAYLYYLPVSFVSGIYLAEKKSYNHKLNLSDFLLFLIFTFLPFIGVFGTNQTIMIKMIIFMPFWMCLFLVVVNNLKIPAKQYQFLMLFSIFLYSLSYFTIGYASSRIHSYYTVHKSKCEIDFGTRYKGLKTAEYEKEYYRVLVDTLESIGFKPGDKVLAFGEQQIGLYLIGGYFHGGLAYSISQYKQIPTERARYIFLFKIQEEELKEKLKKNSWNFPEDYGKIELGTMARVFDEESHRTVIYYLNKQ
jgi:hypothetical protein